ncbi:GDSL esterase/lipase EXL3 [Thalictrum thalictroides]|uniref:GDSL esterase/lipase EXL3 n=1 Tax=Thalictrum thalictroides TaxID=46969 RepID=A0A7J6V4V9_THATH|nr:GDSL esterase/lipase EXL3 [Thalictrum thalictroides]
MQVPYTKLWSLSSSSILVIVFIFLAKNIQIQAVLTLPPNVRIPAIFGFGDSIIDPGNNNNLPTLIRCNFFPYGKDFMGGIPTGRFCNGKIPTDLIAKELGIKELLPAYLDPNLKPTDLLTGVSFASGGAGYDPLTSQIVNVIGLSQQLDLFKEYIGKLKVMVGENATASIISESFYLVVAGSDDIGNTYFNTPFRKYLYDIDAYTDLMVQGAISFIQGLYDMGARRIGVFGAPPIGCVPAQRTLKGGILRQCGENENEAEVLFNSKLASALEKLSTKFQNGRAIYIDIYNPLLDIVNNPNSYGFEVVNKGCCGTGKLEVAILCNKFTPPCEDVNNHVFWDSYHPTQKGYEALVYPLIQKYYKPILCSVTGSC